MASLLDVLLPARCPVCRAPAPQPPCAACLDALPPAAHAPPPPGLDRLAAAWAYQGPTRPVVAALKYRTGRPLLPALAGALAPLAEPDHPAVVTWAPTTPGRRRQRGYDQARWLAEAVADRLGCPARALLERAPPRAGERPQSERPRAERIGAPPRFQVHPHQAVRGRVLLVDDVVTTGATLGAAALALRRAGATSVVGLALARTPAATLRRRREGDHLG